MQVDAVARLDDAQAGAVAALAEAATVADGVSPLSEHVLLHVRNGSAADEDGHSPAHLLAHDQGRLVGYAHLDTGEPAEGVSAEVVVHPEARRRGVGRALVAALRSAAGAGPLRLWSHGHLEAARDFAAADGFTSVRELLADAPPAGRGRPAAGAGQPAGRLRGAGVLPGTGRADVALGQRAGVRLAPRAGADDPR